MKTLTEIPDRQILGKACPVCRKNHLVATRWGMFKDSVEFRITCENVLCKYKPVLIQRLMKHLKDGRIVKTEELIGG